MYGSRFVSGKAWPGDLEADRASAVSSVKRGMSQRYGSRTASASASSATIDSNSPQQMRSVGTGVATIGSRHVMAFVCLGGSSDARLAASADAGTRYSWSTRAERTAGRLRATRRDHTLGRRRAGRSDTFHTAMPAIAPSPRRRASLAARGRSRPPA